MDLRDRKGCGIGKQIFTAIIAAIPTFTYGIQIGWLSPMGPLLKSEKTPADYPFTDQDVSWMATALPLSAICGIPFFSYASDRMGRKISGILVSLLSCISWTIKLTCITPTALITARVIAGLASGGCFIVVPVYIKEISEDSWRGALGSLTMTMCKVGVIFVYAVGMSTTYMANQIVYLAVAVLHVILFSFMPESPNFLLKTGKEQKATRTIAWLRDVRSDSKVVAEEILRLKEEHRRFLELPRVTLRSVVRDRAVFSALRMTLTLMVMQTLSGCFALMNYAADVFERAGTGWSPNSLALVVGSLQLAGSFFTTIFIEKFGRKLPLACSSLAVSVCMATLATCFLAPAPAALPVAAVCVCLLAYGAGLAPVPMVLMAEVFTFQMRARMAGASMALSFFCSSMTVLFYTPIANQFGPAAVFYIFSAITLLGVFYTVLWVPETKGKTLKEIQAFWKPDPEPAFV